MIKKDNYLIIFSFFLMVIGLGFLLSNYYISKKNIVFEQIKMEKFESSELEDIEILKEDDTPEQPDPIAPDDKDNNKDKDKDKKKNNEYDYIGILEIPKINFKRGFVSPNSKYNNISYNVAIIERSTFPNVDKGNFILAAHSGVGEKAYFKNLYKLNTGDMAYITYGNKEYKYKIARIYTQKKTGKLTIYRNPDKTCLTLITCTKDRDDLQTIYVAELI